MVPASVSDLPGIYPCQGNDSTHQGLLVFRRPNTDHVCGVQMAATPCVSDSAIYSQVQIQMCLETAFRTPPHRVFLGTVPQAETVTTKQRDQGRGVSWATPGPRIFLSAPSGSGPLTFHFRHSEGARRFVFAGEENMNQSVPTMPRAAPTPHTALLETWEPKKLRMF